MNRLLFILIVLTLCLTDKIDAQILPFKLKQTEFQNEILKATSDFDSLIIADKASYWTEDMTLHGFGFRGNSVFKVTILYSLKVKTDYLVTLKKVKKSRIKNIKKYTYLKGLNFSKLIDLYQDSLDIMTRQGTYVITTDGDEWTLAIIKFNKFFLKHAYMPNMYSKNNDVLTFIDLIDKFEELRKK